MNEQRIEELLRKAPAKTPPAGLVERMKKDIRLPRSTNSGVGFDVGPSRLKRWLPALALASILLMCLVAVAVQTNLILELKRKNEVLRAATANLEALRGANAEYQKLSAENQELERLQRDNTELQRLRDQVARLGAQSQTPESRQLQAQLAALQAQSQARPGSFSIAQKRAGAEQSVCLMNLVQLKSAAQLWARQHDQTYPPNFISLTNGLDTWGVLQCPSDKSREVSSWTDVAAGNVSYQFPGAGKATSDDRNLVLLSCPIHHVVCMLDGSLRPEGATNQQRFAESTGWFIPSPGWALSNNVTLTYADPKPLSLPARADVIAAQAGSGSDISVALATAQLRAIAAALNAFEVDNGKYPLSLNDLIVKPRIATPDWHQYLDQIPPDPWGNAYIYACPGRHLPSLYDLSSAGPDGKGGTEDDLANWPK